MARANSLVSHRIVTSPSLKPLRLAPELSRDFFLHHRCCPIERTADGAILVAILPHGTHDGLDDISVAYRSLVTTRDVSIGDLER
jgi:hypothetical protein